VTEPIPDDETPIYAQLRKEYDAVERYELFFGVQSLFPEHIRKAFHT
jgi:hypothetical protein